MFLNDLRDNGWAVVDGVTDTFSLIALAESLGDIASNRQGEHVQILRPNAAEAARENTLSSRYGSGEFPLHTDTAFWPTPARFLVMRCTGDMRRRTPLMRFKDLFCGFNVDLDRAVRRSIWQVRGNSGFLCGVTFTSSGAQGFRYDRDCMSPVNMAAFELDSVIRDAITSARRLWIEWLPNQAVIFDNWHALHGRGPAPAAEEDRVLERIYVRQYR